MTGQARRRLRTIGPIVIAFALLVAACGSYDRNPETAKASTTTRRFTTPTATGSTTTTTLAPGASTSSTRSSTTTTRPNASTSTASTTRPPLNPAAALPALRGRLAIIDAQGRLVVAQPNGTSVMPVTNASLGEIAHPTWSPDGSRLVWSATSPVGAQVASSTVGSTTGAVALTLTEPAPTNFSWRPPLARTVLGLPTTTTAPASLARVAWSRTTASSTPDSTENSAEGSTDFGVLDLAAAATLRTLASGSTLYFWLSPDGTRAIVHNGDADLAVVDLDTGVSNPLGVQAAGFETPVWLEGNSVLLAVQAGANRFLSVIDVSTGRRQDLLRYDGTIQFVVDPSGQRIAYQVNSGGGGGNNPAMAPLLQAPTTTIPTATIGRLSVFERRNNSTRSILDSAALAFAWSPTSDRIAFLAQASGGAVQWRFWTERTIESSVLFQPSPAEQRYIAAFTQYDQSTRWFSPDGKAFVFAGRVADLDGVWVQVLDGFGPPARVSGGTFAVWSPQ